MHQLRGKSMRMGTTTGENVVNNAKIQPLIPREKLFADPDKLQVKISPDSRYLSYLASFEGNLNIYLAPIKELEKAYPISKSIHPIRDYWWADDDLVIYSHDHFGDENWQLYSYCLSTQETQTLSERGCQARLLQIGKTKPNKLLVALNERDRHYHDVYVVDPLTGKKECVLENTEYWDFISDGDFKPRVGVKIKEKEGEYVDLTTGGLLSTITQHDLFGLYFYPKLKPIIAKDTFYVVMTNTSDTSTLVAYNLKDKIQHVIAHHPKADICDVLYHPETKTPMAYAVNYHRKQWYGLNEEMVKLFDVLNQYDSAEIDILSRSTKGENWIISLAYDDRPTQYYRYEKETQELIYLFLSHEHLESYTFNSMKAIDVSMRDGVNCVCHLTLPKNATTPLPLVMMIHGGPNFRDFWGFNPYHQWLSNRGYAVLSVNYRGSTGFGKAHSEAGNGQWAGKIREDILDAREWAIREGITTENDVAILGRSFGGYQVLLGLTFTPETYRCGVDIVGPANLETMIHCFPPYWKTMRGVLNDLVGANPDTTEGKAFLREQSPLTYANKIKRPLLIAHGMNDPRVRHEESDQMVAAMQANNVPVSYAVFPNEGHQLSHPGNRMAFYGLAEAFLAKNLGGHAEAYDVDVETTMQMKADDFNLTF